MYRLSNGALVDYQGLILSNPNAYIPLNPSNSDLAHLGAKYVEKTLPPSTQDTEESYISGVEIIDGILKTVWSVRDKTPEELAQWAQEFASLKLNKINALKETCTKEIAKGFYSSALGTPHKYDSDKPQDMINISGAKDRGISLNFTCTDSNGIKARRLHTTEQLKQVFDDGTDFLDSNITHLWAKIDLVSAAQTSAELIAVTW